VRLRSIQGETQVTPVGPASSGFCHIQDSVPLKWSRFLNISQIDLRGQGEIQRSRGTNVTSVGSNALEGAQMPLSFSIMGLNLSRPLDFPKKSEDFSKKDSSFPQEMPIS